jgi:hypothetical protein
LPIVTPRKDAKKRLAKSLALTRQHEASSHLRRKRDLSMALDEILACTIELMPV